MPSPTSPDPQHAQVGTAPPQPLDDFDLFNLVEPEASKAGVPVDLALRVIQQESKGNPHAISPKGAQGLMQLMPDTQKVYGVTNPFDPAQNVKAGVTHLGKLLKQYKGDRRRALADYNGGPAAVAALQRGQAWRETQGYLQGIEGAGGAPGAAQGAVGAPPPEDDFDAFNQRMAEGPEAFGITPPQLPAAGAPPPPAPPNPQDTEYGLAKTLASKALIGTAETFDPTTPTGRRNLAGGAGALAAGALTGGMAPLGAAALAAGGAGIAGGLAESAEQALGTKPASEAEKAAAFRQQAAYEALGQGTGWVLQGVGRRMIASKVGKAAQEGLSAARTATMMRLQTALESAHDVLGKTKEAAAGALAQAKKGSTAAYDQLVGQAPPEASRVGAQVLDVAAGPAQAARDRLGREVEASAEAGPTLDFRPLKEEAARIIDREIAPVASHFPTNAPKTNIPLSALPPEQRALVQRAAAENATESLKTPTMRLLTRFLNAPDEGPFMAAHQFKRELDDALIGVTDKVQKKRLQSLTQHLRSQLRETMAVHEPYNAATKAYSEIMPLFTKGYLPRLRKLAVENPEAIVGMIKPNEPTKVGLLKELLTTRAAEGGDAAAGQAAWANVRGAWTHAHVIKGGIQGLDARLAKLDPAFVKEMYGDASGQQVLSNLHSIANAWDQSVLRTAMAGKGAVNQAKAGVMAARKAKIAAREITPEEKAFLESTVAPGKTHSMETVMADIGRSLALPVGSYWGGISRFRLLFGPKSADLIRWAAYSPRNTQMFVKAVTSTAPGTTLADLLRVAGTELQALRDREQGTPPPKPESMVGAPPPGP